MTRAYQATGKPTQDHPGDVKVLNIWRHYFYDIYGGCITTPCCVYINNRLYVRFTWRFGAVGRHVGHINGVTLRRARLVLGWVTVSGFNSRCVKFVSV